MKYKEFIRWCNERACDGCWGMLEAMGYGRSGKDSFLAARKGVAGTMGNESCQ